MSPVHPGAWLNPYWADEETKLFGLGAIPTLEQADLALHGDAGGILRSVGWTFARAAIIAGGIYVIGGERSWPVLVRESLGASVAIEAFVLLWAALSGGEPLPSDSAADDLLAGKTGSVGHVLLTMLFRGIIAGIGIAVASPAPIRQVVRKAAGAVSAIEASILLSAAGGTKA